jgi:hypothetical protein
MLEVPGASAELSIKSLSDCSKQKWKQLKSVLEVLRESQACSIAFQEKVVRATLRPWWKLKKELLMKSLAFRTQSVVQVETLIKVGSAIL